MPRAEISPRRARRAAPSRGPHESGRAPNSLACRLRASYPILTRTRTSRPATGSPPHPPLEAERTRSLHATCRRRAAANGGESPER